MARSRTTGGKKLAALLRKLPIDIKAGVEVAIRQAGEAVLADAVAAAPAPGAHPYATGNLKGKLRLQVSRNGLIARVGSWGKRRAAHIHLVEFGTAPHEIPIDKDDPGKGVIHHPGAAAMPFLFPAHKKHRSANVALIRKAINTALAKAAGVPVGGGDE